MAGMDPKKPGTGYIGCFQESSSYGVHLGQTRGGGIPNSFAVKKC